MKNKGLKYLFLIGLAGVAIWYFFFRKKPPQNNESETTPKPPVVNVPANNNASAPADPPVVCSSFTQTTVTNDTILEPCTQNNTIKAIQSLTNYIYKEKGLSTIAVDGKFGNDTRAAFRYVIGESSGSFKEFITKAMLKHSVAYNKWFTKYFT